MKINLKAHPELYGRQFTLWLISITTTTLLLRCAGSGKTGLENRFFYSLVRPFMQTKYCSLLVAFMLVGCAASRPPIFQVRDDKDAQRILSWQFEDDSESVTGILVSGKVDDPFNLEIEPRFSTVNPSYPFCGQLTTRGLAPVGLDRYLQFKVEGGTVFEVPILLDYRNPEDSLTKLCTWRHYSTHIRIRDRNKGTVLHVVTLIPYERMQSYYKGKPLPDRLDISCSLKKMSAADTKTAFGACKIHLDATYGWFFGIPNEHLVTIDKNTVLNQLAGHRLEFRVRAED